MKDLSLKFSDPHRTLDGEERAEVRLAAPETLWFNTGTLCNIECVNCYIESSPSNDSLVNLSADEVSDYLDGIHRGEVHLLAGRAVEARHSRAHAFHV